MSKKFYWFLMSVFALSTLSSLGVRAQNTIKMTFSFYHDRDKGNIEYKGGDKVELDLTFAEGAQVSISGVGESKALSGKNSYTLKANPSSKGVMPIVITGDIIALSEDGNTRIDSLIIKSNILEKLDFGYNTVGTFICNDLPKLKEVSCKYAKSLFEAEFKNCPLLEKVNFQGSSYGKNGSLKRLELSGCKTLKEVDCSSNSIETLNLDGCLALENLQCYNNNLETLNLKGCTALSTLNVYKNKLKEINIEGCTALTWIKCLLNNIGAEAAHRLVENLPKLAEGKTHNLDFAQPLGASPAEGNAMKKKDVEAAMAKGWVVRQANESGYEFSNYEGLVTTVTVTLAPAQNGTISIDGYTEEDLKAVEEGTELTVVVKPDPKHILSSLKANDQDITKSLKFTVSDQPITVTAVFVSTKAVTAIENGSVRIYPNPAQEYLHITASAFQKVQLFNLGGLLVEETFTDALGCAVLDLKTLGKGCYLVKAGTELTKVIVE